MRIRVEAVEDLIAADARLDRTQVGRVGVERQESEHILKKDR